MYFAIPVSADWKPICTILATETVAIKAMSNPALPTTNGIASISAGTKGELVFFSLMYQHKPHTVLNFGKI
jgi:hypothetical protein